MKPGNYKRNTAEEHEHTLLDENIHRISFSDLAQNGQVHGIKC